MSDDKKKGGRPPSGRAVAFRVAGWLEAHWDKLPTMSHREATNKCNEELNVTISPQSMTRIIRDMGRELPGWKRNRTVRSERANRGRQLAGQVLILARQVETIRKELGVRDTGPAVDWHFLSAAASGRAVDGPMVGEVGGP